MYRALFLSIQYTHIWDDYMLSVTIDLGYGMVNVLGASGESFPNASFRLMKYDHLPRHMSCV